MLRLAVVLFLASFHIRKVVAAGSSHVLTSSSGEISSPKYPSIYPVNIERDYTIRTEPDTIIRLTFQDFQLESASDCRFDYLEIHDGDSVNARNLGTFCGNSLPSEIRSSQNSLYLRFRTDSSNQFRGFLANYSTIWLTTPSVTNVSVTTMSSTSIRVHWKGPDTTINILNYTVTVTPLARRHSPTPGCPTLPPLHSAISVTVNGSTTETDIHLTLDLDFQVSVIAASSSGLSQPSDIVTGYTLPAASEPVRDLNVDFRAKADSVTFTWKAPCESGGVLSHFLVILEADRKHQNAHNYVLNQTVTQPLQESYSTSMLLSNLTAECMYNVTVIPVGLHELYGANQTTSFHVPARVPTQPLNVSATALSMSAVRVRWEPPAQSHGTLTHYTVTLQPIAKPHSFDPPPHIAVVAVNASTLETDINHLLADTEFQATVTAATSAGQGPPSATFLVHTPSEAEVPTQPQNVSATALSTSSVRVSWEPPAKTRRPVTFYTVTLQPLARQSSPLVFLPKRVVTVSGSTLQSDIKDLVAGTDFQVTVTATTAVGQGPPSASSLVHTPSETKMPTQPRNVLATALSSSQVLVRWEPPAEHTGSLITYTVTLQPVGYPYTSLPGLHTVVSVTGSTYKNNIYHLVADTEYQVTVTAVTADGQGPPSAPTLVHTLPEEKVPTQPHNVSATVLSSSSVLVRWEPPAESTGTLITYLVTLQPVTHHFSPVSDLHMAVVNVTGSTLETNINHLLAETEFQVTVTAVTAAGQGPPSAPILVKTLPEEKGGPVLVPWVLAGVSAAGLVFFFVKWIVARKKKKNTCTNQAESQKDLALDDLLQCD